MVGQVLLWIFLGLLALIVLLLVLPAALELDYRSGKLTVRVRVFFLRFTLFPYKERKPKKPKREKKPKKKKEGKEEDKEKEPEPEKSLEQRLGFVKRVLASAGVAGRFILRHLHVRDVELVLPVNTGEAADTAIWYGRLQAAVGAVRAVAENIVDIHYKQLVVIPDFADEYSKASIFACKVTASPVIMLGAGILALKEFLTYNKKPTARKKKKKPGAKPQPKRSDTHGEQRSPH